MASPTANPYAHIKVTPAVHVSTGTTSMPASVSTVTGGSVIAAGQERTAAHSNLVLAQSGRIVNGGSKRSKRSKRSKCKRSTKRTMFKRSTKRFKRSKRSTKRFKRSKRGGVPTPIPTPGPSVMPVPQFAGAHNAGANANSLASNRVLTNAAAQRAFDNPAAPASNTRVF